MSKRKVLLQPCKSVFIASHSQKLCLLIPPYPVDPLKLRQNSNNAMSQSQNSHRPAASQSLEIRTRQAWETHDILRMRDEHADADAFTKISFLWNEWADSVELILRKMINQIEELKISYDDYLTLVKQFVTYPARPTSGFPILADEQLNRLWNKWADVVESMVTDMKRAIEHSVPLPREEQMVSADEPMDFSLDMSKQDLPPMHMAAHLRQMLQDGTVGRYGLCGSMEDLSIG